MVVSSHYLRTGYAIATIIKIGDYSHTKNPLTTSDSEGIGNILNNFVKYIITLVSGVMQNRRNNNDWKEII